MRNRRRKTSLDARSSSLKAANMRRAEDAKKVTAVVSNRPIICKQPDQLRFVMIVQCMLRHS